MSMTVSEALRCLENLALYQGEPRDVEAVRLLRALASQGDVVAVSELDKLARKWDAKSCRDYGQKSSHAGDLRRLLADHGVTYVIGGDLSAILSRGGK